MQQQQTQTCASCNMLLANTKAEFNVAHKNAQQYIAQLQAKLAAVHSANCAAALHSALQSLQFCVGDALNYAARMQKAQQQAYKLTQ